MGILSKEVSNFDKPSWINDENNEFEKELKWMTGGMEFVFVYIELNILIYYYEVRHDGKCGESV